MAGGNAEDEIGVGRQAEPDGTLGGKGDAGKIGGAIEKVEDDLKMEMRRPAAIFASVADVRKDFATGNALTNFQRRKRRSGEMAIESEEFDARCRRVVKDDDGAVIERRGIIGDRVDGRVKRGSNGRAGSNDKVDAEMHCAALVSWIVATGKLRCGVQGTGFIVSANRDRPLSFVESEFDCAIDRR